MGEAPLVPKGYHVSTRSFIFDDDERGAIFASADGVPVYDVRPSAVVNCHRKVCSLSNTVHSRAPFPLSEGIRMVKRNTESGTKHAIGSSMPLQTPSGMDTN